MNSSTVLHAHVTIDTLGTTVWYYCSFSCCYKFACINSSLCIRDSVCDISVEFKNEVLWYLGPVRHAFCVCH